MKNLNIVIFGLSITSSWGNGHATTFRSLVKALHTRGHQITFFEKDVPWYAAHRDLATPPFCQTILYRTASEIDAYEATLAAADLIILGSYVADAPYLVKKIPTTTSACFAFYDIDTPVTLEKLRKDECEYLTLDMIPVFDVYWSFTGGPTLTRLEKDYGAQRARPLYCSVDPELYYPYNPLRKSSQPVSFPYPPNHYSLGYLGTYSDDRQPTLDRLLTTTAKKMPETRFCVAGAQYPDMIRWPGNVQLIEHIPPHQHRHFYHAQRFTLNVTRQDMIKAGYSPSVRLFEAGACATPVISDYWEGLDSFFSIGNEILVASNSDEVRHFLHMHEDDRLAIATAMWRKVKSSHTAGHRATEIENLWQEISSSPRGHQMPINADAAKHSNNLYAI